MNSNFTSLTPSIRKTALGDRLLNCLTPFTVESLALRLIDSPRDANVGYTLCSEDEKQTYVVRVVSNDLRRNANVPAELSKFVGDPTFGWWVDAARIEYLGSRNGSVMWPRNSNVTAPPEHFYRVRLQFSHHGTKSWEMPGANMNSVAKKYGISIFTDKNDPRYLGYQGPDLGQNAADDANAWFVVPPFDIAITDVSMLAGKPGFPMGVIGIGRPAKNGDLMPLRPSNRPPSPNPEPIPVPGPGPLPPRPQPLDPSRPRPPSWSDLSPSLRCPRWW